MYVLQFCRTYLCPHRGVVLSCSYVEGHGSPRSEIFALNHTARPNHATTIAYIDKLKLRLKGGQRYRIFPHSLKHSDLEVPHKTKASWREWCPPLEIDFIFIVIGIVCDRTSNNLQIRKNKIRCCIRKNTVIMSQKSKRENTPDKDILFVYTVPWPSGFTCT